MVKKYRRLFIIAAAIVLILAAFAAILVRNTNRILKYELEKFLGKDFSVKEIRLTWGELEALGISYRNPEGRQIFSTDRLSLRADFMGLFRKGYVISSLSLKNPYMLFAKDLNGNIRDPFPKREAGRKEKATPPFLIKHIEVTDGALDYLDEKVSKSPVLTKIRDMELEARGIAIPLNEEFTPYSLTAGIPGNMSTGTLQSTGRIKLKTKDADFKVKLNNLDITTFKPYFQKKSDVNITRGFLDLDMTVKISANKIYAPGSAVLRNLQFQSGAGAGEKFLSIPLYAVVSFLKDHNDRIVFDFILEGDLSNPKFNVRQSLIEKITLGIAEKLGLPVTKIGDAIIVLGTEGVKQIEKEIKGLGEGIRHMFK